ncbi:pseudaminic acid synthase [Roseibium sp. SCP14]|uniref:pseudaminic acid synthase n=1 Tax=Roseibium sp. SCP14 TaxID=3141375 RepID=UPI003339FDD9
MSISIDDRKIGIGNPPYVIAELSANHNGNLENALSIIKIAKEAGANAVKIQTYRPDTITLKSDAPDFQIADGPWEGRSLYDLYDWAHTPWEWHEKLFSYAKELGITLFSSPFDFSAVDLLEDLGSPAYKIASFEAVDLPLIRYVASKGKPLIISTGMADLQEIEEAVAAARKGGCEELALLLCVSGYPAPPSDYNLVTIRDMISRFDVPIGLSDHTLDNTTAIASVAIGASILEKHVTLDRAGGGPDDSFSLEPNELSALCQDAKTAWTALGEINYGRKSSESSNVKFRRSLYFVRSLDAGDVITEGDVRSVRPGYGAPPKFLDVIIGKKLRQAVDSNSPVLLENIIADD